MLESQQQKQLFERLQKRERTKRRSTLLKSGEKHQNKKEPLGEELVSDAQVIFETV